MTQMGQDLRAMSIRVFFGHKPERIPMSTSVDVNEPSASVTSSTSFLRPEGRTTAKAAMNSTVKKRSIVIGRHKTSISLEDHFWACVRQIARERATTASELIGMLDAERNGGNLSSTVRVFVLEHYRNKVASTALPSPATQCGQLSDQNTGLSQA